MHKILIVEDDDFLKTLESEKFVKEGLEVLTASDETQMATIIAETPPDIILLDLMLPKTDGFQIIQNLKADDKTKDIIVVVFSNLSDDTSIEKAKKAGAEDFIIKSNFSIKELADKLKSFLK